jgi:hypothetical protein
MDRHSSELEEMDVEGILAHLQQVFFPDGIRFDGKRLVGTRTTVPIFNY